MALNIIRMCYFLLFCDIFNGHSVLGACSSSTALGLESGDIIDRRITASSELNNSTAAASQARLNNQPSPGSDGAWTAAANDLNQWLRISLYRQINITGIQIQGSPNDDRWVTKFKIEGSLGNDIWDIKIFDESMQEKIFDGNSDRNSVLSHNFVEPIIAQYVQIRPVEWHGGISMRLELLGCSGPELPCTDAMGLADRTIKDEQIFVYSTLSVWYKANSRLMSSHLAWVPASQNTNQYIGVNFYRQVWVTGVVVQGPQSSNAGHDYWVKTYKVQFSLDNVVFEYVKDEAGVDEIFEGSWDRSTPVTHYFHAAILGQYVRIRPITYLSYMAVRFEFIGCRLPDMPMDPLGMESKVITNSQITFSSGGANSKGRLNTGHWVAAAEDLNPWFQISLWRQTNITGVVTLGRSATYNWYTSKYRVDICLDGVSWENVTDENGDTEVFEGNWVYNQLATHLFYRPILAQYIRIRPVEWKGNASPHIQIELLGSSVPTLECLDYIASAALGLEDGRIDDAQLTASGGEATARYGRLNFQSTPNVTEGGWVAGTDDSNQWLQICMYRQTRIGGVIIQGRQDQNEWVTRYQVSTSLDGSTWEFVEDQNGDDEIFEGSWDRDTHVVHHFHDLVEAQYVRILPVEWHGHISIRLEILGCQLPVLPCYEKLGLENDTIVNDQISASSSKASVYPYQARLNSATFWSPGINDQNQWLEFNFYRAIPVTGVILQGSPDADQWVTRYHVLYSLDGQEWDAVEDSNYTTEVFEGCWDRITPATHSFNEEIIAKFVRIQPLEWYGDIALRLELLGCSGEQLPCVDPLGVEIGNITDSQLAASSKLHNDTSATSARLNSQPNADLSQSQGAWVSEFDDQNQWIQASLLRQIPITGVIVQGHPSTDKWVTKFKVQYSLNNVGWLFVTDSNGNEMVFPGSVDRDTPVVNTFQELVTGQYIRVVPTEWHGNISMRFELLGCQIDFTCLETIGLEDYNVTDAQMKASTSYGALTAKKGRLNGPWMWMSTAGSPYIEVNLYRQIKLRGVIVQGSPYDVYPSWTKTYRVKTSLGYHVWTDVLDDDGAVETFEGSWDRFAPVTHLFFQHVYAQYVRIYPITKSGYFVLRFELLGCRAQRVSCQDFLGMKNGDILLNQITSSTPVVNSVSQSRLDSTYAWRPSVSENSWLQVNLLRQTIVTGVIMQGRGNLNHYVKSYQMITSLDALNWHNVTDEDNKTEIFEANWIYNVKARHLFSRDIEAQYIKILPLTFSGYINIRMELLGCKAPTLPCIDPFGMETGLIRDDQITASSASSDTASAFYARFNQLAEGNVTSGAWVAGVSDTNQWLEVNLFRQAMVTGVNMQGNPSADQWVTRYKVEVSLDHTTWEYVVDEYGDIEVFEGSYDRGTNNTHLFYQPVTAHYVRIRPTEWHGQISMRLELLGCPVTPVRCQDPMGIEVGNVTDDQLTASSVSGSFDATNARLNLNGGWVAGVTDQDQWLQIDLYRQLRVTGVVLQGRGDAEEWVTTYNVEYGIDGVTWGYVRDDNETVELFEGSWDQNSLATHLFFEGVIAQYIRIRPRSWNGNIALRVELLGCQGILLPCQDKLGLENGNITDDQLEASSDLSNGTGFLHWRLNQEAVTGIPGAWVALSNDEQPWFQIGLYRHTQIAGVIVQGRADVEQWVTSYKVQASLDRTNWLYVEDYAGVEERFEGSWDQSTPVTHLFHEAVLAQYVKILPQSWYGNASMRCELLGCPTPVLPCYDALGMEDYNISDTEIYSSTTTGSYLSELARLNIAGAWRPYYNNANQWIVVQFLRQLPITGIITQGEEGGNRWVTRYKVDYSLDSIMWDFVLDENGDDDLFEANWDDNTPATNYFFSPVIAHYIRIKPTNWYSGIALRLELLGCLNKPLPCQDPLGMEDGLITDQQFSASANLSEHGVSFARLNSPSAWLAQYNNLTQWFKVFFRTPILVTGIIMQGRKDADSWVTRYRVMTSLDDVIWENVTDEDGITEVFEGSWDRNTPVTHLFYTPVTAFLIRIHPLEWNNDIAMRFELLGCEDTEAPVVISTPMNITTSTDPGLPVASVNWTSPMATDNSHADVTLESNYSPMDNFTIGSTNVIYKVMDPSGNYVNYTFIVTVIDSEAPIFRNFRADITVQAKPSNDSAVVNWTEPIVFDNSGYFTIESNFKSWDRFPVGDTVVTYNVYDGHGNNASHSFTVSVEGSELTTSLAYITKLQEKILLENLLNSSDIIVLTPEISSILEAVILHLFDAAFGPAPGTPGGDVNELLNTWEDIMSTPLQSDEYSCLNFEHSFDLCVSPSVPGKNQFNVDLADGSSLDVTLTVGDGVGFVTIGALISLPENVTLKLKGDSDGDGETRVLGPVLTINMFDSTGSLQAYESDDPLEIGFPLDPDRLLKPTTHGTVGKPGCYYYTQDGYWTEDGCKVVDSMQESVLTCQCTHLTSFSALMRFVEQEKPYSRVVRAITYLGNGCSIFSLILGLVGFSILRWKESLHKERLFIHRQLMFALLFALTIFMMSETAAGHPIACKVMAVFLFHALISVFCWMLVEAVHLYRLIVIVYGGEKDFSMAYYCIGWGLPILISAIVLGMGHDKFGTGGGCWLSKDDGFIWAFLAPVLLIIAVNTIVLAIVIQKTVKASKISAEHNIDVVKTGIRSALLLLPMLGIFWLFGITANWNMVVAYIFDIINSCQGVWLVIVCCVLNSEVRGAMKTEWHKTFGYKISNKESGSYAAKTLNQTAATDMTNVD